MVTFLGNLPLGSLETYNSMDILILKKCANLFAYVQFEKRGNTQKVYVDRELRIFINPTSWRSPQQRHKFLVRVLYAENVEILKKESINWLAAGSVSLAPKHGTRGVA